MSKKETVAVLGASPKPDRYSNKAVKLLIEKGHNVIPIHPIIKEIEGLNTIPNLKSVDTKVDTITMYMNPKISIQLINDIIDVNPGRVIFNPGTESEEIEKILHTHNISFEKACTLVLLRTNQF